MEYLRWILLGAGILFVAFIYLKYRPRKRSAIDYGDDLDAEVPEFSANDLSNVDEGVGAVRVVASMDTAVDEPSELATAETDSDTDTATTSDAAAPQIIQVFITAPSRDKPFRGDSINSAAQACGLSYGDMKIFHKQDEDGQILFSMANMLKPGSFDVSTMFETETTGLVLFMQAELLLAPSLVLEDMLQTAYRLSEMLGGQLCNHRRQPLSQQDTEAYRQQVSA